jgi:cbb3-type cytochrome oxidase subunit 1
MSVVYLMVGIAMGLYMAISQNHSTAAAHAHVNLLGWASLALCGLLYEQYPVLQRHWLARAHFWLHSLALPVFMSALFLYLQGNVGLMPVVAIGANLTALGLLFFVINVLTRLRATTVA